MQNENRRVGKEKMVNTLKGRHGKMVKKRAKLKLLIKKQEPIPYIYHRLFISGENEIFSSSNKENQQLSLQKQHFSQNDALLVYPSQTFIFQSVHGFASSISTAISFKPIRHIMAVYKLTLQQELL